MKKLTFILSLAVTLSSYAQKQEDDIVPVSIKPAPEVMDLSPTIFAPATFGIGICKSIDLTVPGGSLETLKVTNQGPYGICHIEQISRMLKAKLNGHPDLARISMAMQEKEIRDRELPADKKKAVGWVDKNKVPQGVYFNTGQACSTFALLKEAELCEAKDDMFESFSKMDIDKQKTLLDALMVFFDARSKKPDTSQRVMTILKALTNDVKTASLQCRVNTTFVESFTKAYKEAGGKGDLRSLLDPLETDQYFSITKMNEYLKAALPDIDTVVEKNPGFRTFQTGMIAQLNLMDSCISAKLKDAPQVCALGDDKQIKDILNLTALGFNGRDLYRFFSLTSDRDEYFSKIGKCEGKKIKIPKSLKCIESPLGILSKRADFVEVFIQTLEKKLEEGTPIGVSVCTRFFTNPKAVTAMTAYGENSCGNKNDLHYVKDEGSHAVTIIGKRCNKKGVVEFLIHNSWGRGCGGYAKEYDCNNNGGFWVPAEVLAKNTKILSVIE